MAERVDKSELTHRVARRLDRDGETVAEIVDGFLEEIYAALKRGDRVSLRGFGSFYVRAERDSWVFRFSPSQRLRALLVGRRPTAGRCELYGFLMRSEFAQAPSSDRLTTSRENSGRPDGVRRGHPAAQVR
jgi:DNA-binding protein HU-beta